MSGPITGALTGNLLPSYEPRITRIRAKAYVVWNSKYLKVQTALVVLFLGTNLLTFE